MTKINILLAWSLLFFSQCALENNCPPNSKKSLIVQDSIKAYFSYQPNSKVIFKKYNDTSFVGENEFVIDTSRFIESTHYSFECQDGRSLGQYFIDEYSEHLVIKFINQTELGKDITLKFKGEFNVNSTTGYDPSSLIISLYNYENSIYNFYDIIVKENSKNWIDPFILHGKNYGKVYCVSPSWKQRIYLNKQFGIIAYIDDTDKIKLVAK